MRFVISLLFLLPTLSHAEHRNLLDCNTSDGPDQQVTVRQEEDGSLTLIELLISGMQVRRPLSQEEWDGRKLQLQDGPYDAKTTLRQVTDGWVFESKGFAVNSFGYADCWDANGDF